MHRELNLISFQKHIKNAIKIRAFELTLLDLFSSGKIRGTVHTSLGQELFSSLIYDFILDCDYIFGNHRSHAHFLSYSNCYTELLSEILGKNKGCSRGLGGSQHLNYKNFYTNGIQGSMTGIALGTAHAQKIFSNNGVSVSLLGDGTFGAGQIYESFNISSKMSLPVIYIVENNQIAQSTPTQNTLVGSFEEKFSAFDIYNKVVDIDDSSINSTYTSIHDIFDFTRSKKRPAALIINTQRLGPHSKGDDNRGQENIDELWRKDFISKIIKNELEWNNYFLECKHDFQQLGQQIINYEDAKVTFEDYAVKNLKKINLKYEITSQNLEKKYIDITHSSLKLVMEKSQGPIIIGEDIEFKPKGTREPYGGAFKATRNLSENYPTQVINFPISESSIVGFGIGYALSGHSSICEIMFSDFLTLTIDQFIQQATKIPSMYGKFKPLSLMVRAPGGGRRGYGPTHSQNMEHLFIGLPNLVIYSANIFSSVDDYVELLKLDVPVLVIENKDLYLRKVYSRDESILDTIIVDNRRTIHYSFKNIKSSGLIVTYGFATELVIKCVQKILQEHEILFEIVVLQIINPLDIDSFNSILENHHRVIVIEETLSGGGITSSLVKLFSKQGIEKTFLNLGGQGNIGASAISEENALISEEKIMNFLTQLVGL